MLRRQRKSFSTGHKAARSGGQAIVPAARLGGASDRRPRAVQDDKRFKTSSVM